MVRGWVAEVSTVADAEGDPMVMWEVIDNVIGEARQTERGVMRRDFHTAALVERPPMGGRSPARFRDPSSTPVPRGYPLGSENAINGATGKCEIGPKPR